MPNGLDRIEREELPAGSKIAFMLVYFCHGSLASPVALGVRLSNGRRGNGSGGTASKTLDGVFKLKQGPERMELALHSNLWLSLGLA